MNLRVWLRSLQIFNSILRPLFSASAQLSPSLGQTCATDPIPKIEPSQIKNLFKICIEHIPVIY